MQCTELALLIQFRLYNASVNSISAITAEHVVLGKKQGWQSCIPTVLQAIEIECQNFGVALGHPRETSGNGAVACGVMRYTCSEAVACSGTVQ